MHQHPTPFSPLSAKCPIRWATPSSKQHAQLAALKSTQALQAKPLRRRAPAHIEGQEAIPQRTRLLLRLGRTMHREIADGREIRPAEIAHLLRQRGRLARVCAARAGRLLARRGVLLRGLGVTMRRLLWLWLWLRLLLCWLLVHGKVMGIEGVARKVRSGGSEGADALTRASKSTRR